MRRPRLLLACLCLAAACGEPRGAEEPVDDAPPGSDRPAQAWDTVRIEGMAEPVELRLARTPDGFPLPFSTYAPAGFEVLPVEGPAPGLRFVAAFAGQAEPEAFLEIAVLPVGAAPADAPAVSPLAVRETPEGERRYPWSVAEWGLEGLSPPLASGSAPEPVVGTVAVGRRGMRYFRLISRYPVSFGDGFPARAQVILDSLRWLDGSALPRR